MQGRRSFLRACGVATVGLATAGCLSAPSDAGGTTGGATTGAPTTTATPTTQASAVTEVESGPEGRLRFVPEDVDVSVGDTVRWLFLSPGHNVTSKPGASELCRNPEGAEPFASYEGDEHFSVVPEGETYEHQFTTPGEYVYVCAPHAGQGMVGSVAVSE